MGFKKFEICFYKQETTKKSGSKRKLTKETEDIVLPQKASPREPEITSEIRGTVQVHGQVKETIVLLNSFRQLREMRRNWEKPGWTAPKGYAGICKYFKNLRGRCAKKGITVPETDICERSSIGLALGIVWDTTDPTTQWNVAYPGSILKPAHVVEDNIQSTTSTSRHSGRAVKIKKHFVDEGFNTAGPLVSMLSGNKESVAEESNPADETPAVEDVDTDPLARDDTQLEGTTQQERRPTLEESYAALIQARHEVVRHSLAFNEARDRIQQGQEELIFHAAAFTEACDTIRYCIADLLEASTCLTEADILARLAERN
jgi:hypothetical protein